MWFYVEFILFNGMPVYSGHAPAIGRLSDRIRLCLSTFFVQLFFFPNPYYALKKRSIFIQLLGPTTYVLAEPLRQSNFIICWTKIWRVVCMYIFWSVAKPPPRKNVPT